MHNPLVMDMSSLKIFYQPCVLHGVSGFRFGLVDSVSGKLAST
jgi:hypothetical protein